LLMLMRVPELFTYYAHARHAAIHGGKCTDSGYNYAKAKAQHNRHKLFI